MKRTLITVTLVASLVFALSAKFMAVLKDGSVVELPTAEFVSDGDDAFTISGIAVDQISRLYNKADRIPDSDEKMTPPDSYILPACVLDINGRNNMDEASEDGRYLYSAQYMMEVAGLPYFTTDDLDKALAESSLILISNNLREKSFTSEEVDRMQKWVEDGGILIGSAIEVTKVPEMLDLFGIKAVNSKVKTHSIIRWADEPYEELVYFDQPEEHETYIGQSNIFTYEYTPSTAIALAYFDDTSIVAVTKNAIGKGCAYNVGLRWRDVIQRNQLNKSGKDRFSNNNFEASADMFPFFVRAAYAANSDVTPWKHTIPQGYETVIIPTHDCDSRTALDQMYWLADYEQAIGLRAHYFITTHYFRQPNYMSAFYIPETYPSCIRLLEQGHTVGSHSTCHLGDFSNTSRFPITVTTPEEYAETCVYDPDKKETTGGSTWAEIIMSKNMLEEVLHNNVRSFRSGHLCFNENIPETLVMGEFSFTSCFTATDLRGEFPFFQRMRGAWTGEQTNVLQMPLHFSDVRPAGEEVNDNNWEDAIPVWKKCHDKLKGNYAPNILLIHPNKKFKMEMQKAFINKLDLNVGLYNFEEYGEFWIKRGQMDYKYAIEDGVLKIVVDTDNFEELEGQGIVVDTQVDITKVMVANRNFGIHNTQTIIKDDSRFIIVL